MKDILNKITSDSLRQRVNPQFQQDVEFVTKLQLKDLNETQEIAKPAFQDSLRYLFENFRLTPLYRRFISPRKLVGKAIDRLKNKFYYETHHFIGAIIEKQEQLNMHTANTIDKLNSRQDRTSQTIQKITDVLKDLSGVIKSLKNDISHLQSTSLENQNILQDQISAHNQKIATLSAFHASQIEQIESSLETLNEKLQQVANDSQKNATEVTALQTKITTEIQQLKYPDLDFNYVGFERKFYGNHESLQEKHKHYLKVFEGCQNMLDIGCGTGAFITLLRKNNIIARGIDSNPKVIADCQKNGVPAKTADALTYLRKLPNNFLDGISCFHMIEHLHTPDLLEFLRLCFDKLKKGQSLALETPNTRMLGILNHGFFMDPTHIRPVHPETVEFVLKDLGFTEVFSYTQSQLPQGDRLEKGSDPTMNSNISKLNSAIFGDQDVSIIAKK